MPFVRLRTLKQRAPRPRCRPTKEEQLLWEVPFRAVPLPDPGYVRRLKEYFATFRLLTRRATPMWDVASQETSRNWLRAAVPRAALEGGARCVLTPHTFRHNYAVHLLINGLHIKQVQALMGHKRLENTEVYTKIFALDVMPDLAFSLAADEARQLLAIPAPYSF